MNPFYEREGVQVYLGDCLEVLPALELQADVAICDPPYGDTSLAWDRWPDGWVDAVVASLKLSGSLWCFGSMRTFWTYDDEFDHATMAQDIVWEKHNGSSLHNDRFKRVHELAIQFYRGDARWVDVYKRPVMTLDAEPRIARRQKRPKHFNDVKPVTYKSEAGGPKLMRSVFHVRSCHGLAENETQKPVDVISPLVAYSCPPGGLVLSPFAGSGTDGVVAFRLGMRAVLIDSREEQCEIAARRISSELHLPPVANVLTPTPEQRMIPRHE